MDDGPDFVAGYGRAFAAEQNVQVMAPGRRVHANRVKGMVRQNGHLFGSSLTVCEIDH